MGAKRTRTGVPQVEELPWGATIKSPPGVGALAMAFPRPTKGSRALFEALIPADPEVAVRPMFGNLAAFHRGNMFAGVFGAEVMLRLGDTDRAALLQVPGTSVFEPMQGRPMKEYVQLPTDWQDAPAAARPWVARSLRFVGTLPPKDGGAPPAAPRSRASKATRAGTPTRRPAPKARKAPVRKLRR